MVGQTLRFQTISIYEYPLKTKSLHYDSRSSPSCVPCDHCGGVERTRMRMKRFDLKVVDCPRLIGDEAKAVRRHLGTGRQRKYSRKKQRDRPCYAITHSVGCSIAKSTAKSSSRSLPTQRTPSNLFSERDGRSTPVSHRVHVRLPRPRISHISSCVL